MSVSYKDNIEDILEYIRDLYFHTHYEDIEFSDDGKFFKIKRTLYKAGTPSLGNPTFYLGAPIIKQEDIADFGSYRSLKPICDKIKNSNTRLEVRCSNDDVLIYDPETIELRKEFKAWSNKTRSDESSAVKELEIVKCCLVILAHDNGIFTRENSEKIEKLMKYAKSCDSGDKFQELREKRMKALEDRSIVPPRECCGYVEFIICSSGKGLSDNGFVKLVQEEIKLYEEIGEDEYEKKCVSRIFKHANKLLEEVNNKKKEGDRQNDSSGEYTKYIIGAFVVIFVITFIWVLSSRKSSPTASITGPEL